MSLRGKTNLELARTALDALEELDRRGNHSLDVARQAVFYFYEDVLGLTAQMEALAYVDDLRENGEPDFTVDPDDPTPEERT